MSHQVKAPESAFAASPVVPMSVPGTSTGWLAAKSSWGSKENAKLRERIPVEPQEPRGAERQAAARSEGATR